MLVLDREIEIKNHKRTLIVERHPLGFSRSLNIFKRNSAVVPIYSSENNAIGSKVLSEYHISHS